jgi:tRNA nucleotidyltransferase/poly(A) polymerase
MFIGDAATRIAEDGLRSLRFFRFMAAFGKPPADDAALTAIADKKEMLTQLSGERVANEMRKLLSTHNPAYALRLMNSTGAAPLVFGRAIEPSIMIRLQMLEGQAKYQASVWARALALLSSAGIEDAEWIIDRWKVSRHEAKQLKLLASLPAFDARAPRHTHTRLIRLHAAPAYLDWLMVQAASKTGIDVATYVALAHEFTPPTFPISANDLMAKGMKEGKALGEALAALEKRWEESDYQLSKEDLLD